ncbi:MAG TPA: hypothetical protein VHV30_13375 [Polyangiaceae bacterium]|jgi:hypothetical protein|nr:hypothetical protein [Polyangiaceae bacterium]
MLYEFAVEPAVLSSWQRVRYFLDGFGPSKGRLLAEYPKRWKRMVYEALATSGVRPVEKARIEERLRSLDKSVLVSRQGAVFDPARPWLKNAEQEHARQPFRAIIANEASSCPQAIDADDVDERSPMWNVEHGRLVARTPEGIGAALGPLVARAERVIVVDPYFSPMLSSKIVILGAIARQMREGAALEVHVALKEDGPQLEWLANAARKRIGAAVPTGIQVVLRYWRVPGPHQPAPVRFHNRYVMTATAGVKFGDSLERGDEGHEDHVSLLDETSRGKLWRQYDQGEGLQAAARLTVDGGGSATAVKQ